jgi:hypothetical protein
MIALKQRDTVRPSTAKVILLVPLLQCSNRKTVAAQKFMIPRIRGKQATHHLDQAGSVR